MDFRYLINLCEAAYDSKIAALVAKYPDAADAINWAKTLKKQDRAVWYLNTLEKYLANPTDKSILANRDLAQFQEDLMHYLGQETIAKLQNYQFQKQTAEQVFTDLAAIEREVQKKQQQDKQQPGRFLPQKGDVDLIKFADGTRWVKLNTAYCSKEAKSGGHCGNVAGQNNRNQRILSLRKPDDGVILTFILEPNGYLGEMKARFNKKPNPKYYPQIVELLMQNYIKGIKSGGYLSEENFNLFDLDEKFLKLIHENKPRLIISQLDATPLEILNAPDWLKKIPEYINQAKRKHPQIAVLLQNPSEKNWKDAVEKSPKFILYAPESLPNYKNMLLSAIKTGKLYWQLPSIVRKHSNDFDLLKQIIERYPSVIEFIPTNHKQYTELAILALEKDGDDVWEKIPPEAYNEKMAIAAVKSIGYERWLFAYLPKNVITSTTYLEALKSGSISILDIPVRFRTPEIHLEAVKQYGYHLQNVPVRLRTPELCLEAVKNKGYALKYVPLKLRTPELCLIAVKQDGDALQYVPRKLRTPELCVIAVKNDASLKYVPSKYQTEELALLSVKKAPWSFRELPINLRTLKVCIAALKRWGVTDIYKYVPKKLRPQVKKELGLREEIDRIKQLAGL